MTSPVPIDSFNQPAKTRSPRFPPWLRKKIPAHGTPHAVGNCIAKEGLHTVCTEARCPNQAECYTSGTAAFLIMGNVCTRNCGFCAVDHGIPGALDLQEPEKVARAARRMGLRHIVVTSVTRDDLPLGGAEHFAETIRQCRELLPNASIEVLVPDFKGSREALDIVLAAKPDILNHNLETVPRLYPLARPQAGYDRSLDLLSYAAEKKFIAKSGIMVGLGETEEEVKDLLADLRKIGCAMVTIGQYLQPSKDQLAVVEFITPEQFEKYESVGKELGFRSIQAGPFVRSSYHAGEVYNQHSLNLK